jgi:hypothetical protein
MIPGKNPHYHRPFLVFFLISTTIKLIAILTSVLVKKQISSDVLVPRSKELLVLLSAKGNDFEQRAGRRSP